MKYKSLLSIVLSSFLLIHCEMKPVEDVFGLSPEETSQLFGGLVANSSLIDNQNGTVRDPLSGLLWQKCTYGQVYRAGANDCLGRPVGSPFNPNDYNIAGALRVAFCDSRTHACNTLSAPQTLTNEPSIAIQGSSELFAACAQLGAGWRVPTPLEMQRLVIPGRAATLAYFPSTVEDEYWTAWSNYEDLPGETAFAISFDRQSYGTLIKTAKTQRNYVRCVRFAGTG